MKSSNFILITRMQKRGRLKAAIKKIIDCFNTRLPKMPNYNPFELLIVAIISQNTSDFNTFRAMREIRKYGPTPRKLSSTRVEDIAKMIKIAGLQRQKARRIKNVSRFILKNYGGDIKKIIKLPDDFIRKELTSIKGIGPKTADVFLAFAKGSSVVPIDTHIFRISRRLGITDTKDTYEEVQRKLQALIARRNRVLGHLVMIEFGRKICKARKPKCKICPVQKFCPSSIYLQ